MMFESSRRDVYYVLLYSVRHNTDSIESSADHECCTTGMKCFNNPCMNGAICREDFPNQSYNCDCPPAFTGVDCETGV